MVHPLEGFQCFPVIAVKLELHIRPGSPAPFHYKRCHHVPLGYFFKFCVQPAVALQGYGDGYIMRSQVGDLLDVLTASLQRLHDKVAKSVTWMVLEMSLREVVTILQDKEKLVRVLTKVCLLAGEGGLSAQHAPGWRELPQVGEEGQAQGLPEDRKQVSICRGKAMHRGRGERWQGTEHDRPDREGRTQGFARLERSRDCGACIVSHVGNGGQGQEQTCFGRNGLTIVSTGRLRE